MSTTNMGKATGFEVKVWFATSDNFRTVARGLREFDAMREARQYLSDSRAICIVHTDTKVTYWVKRPRGDKFSYGLDIKPGADTIEFR